MYISYDMIQVKFEFNLKTMSGEQMIVTQGNKSYPMIG
jgi:hypothetical protein